jgi:hypothetical protein
MRRVRTFWIALPDVSSGSYRRGVLSVTSRDLPEASVISVMTGSVSVSVGRMPTSKRTGPKAGCHRARAAQSTRELPGAHDGAVDKERASKSAHERQGKPIFDARFGQPRAADGLWLEGAGSDFDPVGIARQVLQLSHRTATGTIGIGEGGRGNRQDPRPELILPVPAHRLRSAGVEALAGMDDPFAVERRDA